MSCIRTFWQNKSILNILRSAEAIYCCCALDLVHHEANGRQSSARLTGIEPHQTQRQTKTSRQACTAFAASIYQHSMCVYHDTCSTALMCSCHTLLYADKGCSTAHFSRTAHISVCTWMALTLPCMRRAILSLAQPERRFGWSCWSLPLAS